LSVTRFQLLQTVFFEGDVVVVVEVVEAYNSALLHLGEETLHEVGADEAGGAGDEDGSFHLIKNYEL